MSIVSLSLAKLHCKIDGNEEDELLALYIRAAESWFSNYIGEKKWRRLVALDQFPGDLEHAVLDLVAFHYRMRGLVTFGASAKIAPDHIISVAGNYRENWFGEPEPEAVTDGA